MQNVKIESFFMSTCSDNSFDVFLTDSLRVYDLLRFTTEFLEINSVLDKWAPIALTVVK